MKQRDLGINKAILDMMLKMRGYSLKKPKNKKNK
tara:strand:- start:139 stop:240 length:102 start_codon:yes stop_codon:yes gene_type:complete